MGVATQHLEQFLLCGDINGGALVQHKGWRRSIGVVDREGDGEPHHVSPLLQLHCAAALRSLQLRRKRRVEGRGGGL